MNIITKGSLALLALATVGSFRVTSVQADEMQPPVHIEAIIDLTGTQPITQPNVDLTALPKKLTEKETVTLEKLKELKITVQDGDTLNQIAEKFNVSVDSLQYNNEIAESHSITVGESLVIGGTEFEKEVPESFYKEQEVKAEAKKKAAENEAREKAELAEKVKQEEVKKQEAKQKEDLAKQEVAKQEATKSTPVVQETVDSAPVEAKVAEPKQEVAAQSSTSGYQVTVEATAYSRNQPSLSNFTANGTDLRSNPNVIAVDPSQIPIGSQVYVPGYGTFTAADTGGDIHHGRIDIHMESLSSAQSFGRRSITVTVLN